MIDACKGIRMHHSALSVSDWDRSMKFYCDGLGFVKMNEFPGFFPEQKIAMLRLPGGGVIEMFSHGKPGIPSQEERTFQAGTYFQYCFQVETPEQVDALYHYTIDELGAKSYVPPAMYDAPACNGVKAYAAFVTGPDGEILEFIRLAKEYAVVPPQESAE